MVTGCIGTTDDAAEDPDDATGIVFHGGTIWTGDGVGSEPGAVAVVGDRIVAVGATRGDVQDAAGDRPFFVDLQGGLLLPGFHDTHNHLVRSVFNDEPGDEDPYAPWPPGWDPVTGTAAQQETAAGHIMTWANNNADRIIAGEIPEPPHAATAEVAGHGHDHVHAIEGRDAANDLGVGEVWRTDRTDPPMLDAAQAASARFGITSHVEAGAPLSSLDALQTLDAEGRLTARYNLYLFPEDLDTALEQGLATGDGTESARLLGLKIYSDGWLGPRTAALRDLYNDRPHQGFIFYSQDEVDDYVLRAHEGGLKLTAHSIGDRAVDRMVTAYERALAAGGCNGHRVCDDPRFSLEHVQLIQADLLERFVALGLVPSIQLSFATSDSHWAEMALGPERIEDSYTWQRFLDAGLRVGGSSDWPIEVLPPLWGVERVVTRQEVDESLGGPFMPEQAVSLDAALRMITTDAAHLEFREDELGRIAPGYLADLVVLGEDLWSIDPSGIAETPVWLTMVDGRVVHAQGPLAATVGDGTGSA